MNTERAAIVVGAAVLLVIVLNLGLVVGLLRSKPADGVRKWLGAARRLGDPWAEEDEALRELRNRVTAFEADREDEVLENEG
ncbi:MAG TPA: hypothetical protein VJK02_21945 [Anaerolineales bacterium]|nr:hypothetical protein [Anaerolineales bacterium]